MTNDHPAYTDQDLTAYALGELDPAGDAHRAIAEALGGDPAIRAEIDAIKQSAADVRGALAHEPVPAATGGASVSPVLGHTGRRDACPTDTKPIRTTSRSPLFARPALLAAGFALAAGAAIAVVSLMRPDDPPQHADTAPTPRGLDAIHTAMDAPVTASFQEATIGEVFDAVHQATHAEVAVDWPALEARGLTKDTTMTFDADALPARDLLSLALAAAWRQLPHPDPVVWTVTPDAVRIEPRSAVVQRSLDHTQRVLASINTTNARMTQSQLALADNASWQQPEAWTDAYWGWREARLGEGQGQQQEQMERLEELAEVDGEIARPEAESEYIVEALASPIVTVQPASPPGRERSRSNQPAQQVEQLQQQMQQMQAQTRTAESRFYAGEGIDVRGRDRSLGRTDTLDAGVDAYYRQLDPVSGVTLDWRTDGLYEDKAGYDGVSPAQVQREVRRRQSRGEQVQQQAQQQLQEAVQFDDFERLDRGPDPRQLNRDTYALVNDNPFHTGFNDPLSTFSVDVDTAAYSIVRRQLMQQHVSPVPGAVRIEELVNYFSYEYEAPEIDPALLDSGVVTRASLERLAEDDDSFAPFATHVEVTDCPWADGHRLVRIGVKGMEVQQQDRPTAHLTFLLDVSGSMNNPNKLPLVKESMRMLLTQLNADDHVSIVVYAGAAGLVLEHASAADVPAIEAALDKLSAGGSTAGGAGIELAYDIAQRHFVDGGVNRVILCTDGDFNVGVSDRDALVELIKDKANPEPDDSGATRGVYLSVMGFGFGNLNDNMMEPLTNAGNGNYAYIDTAAEAHKVMVEQVGGTLVAIAKDVKVQVEFNPTQVLAYRLIGYENRILAAEDFENDTVDAGDIGAGHTVTALYEVVPFPAADGLDNEETLREVKLQIEELDAALAFNTSVLENTPLTEEQYQKLVGSVRMLQQQRAVAVALEGTVKRRSAASTVGEGPAGIDLRYRRGAEFVEELDELLVVNLRYKPVDAPAEQGTSRLIQTAVAPHALPFEDASEDTRFAAAVAGFGMVLRNSPHRGEADFQWVLDTAGDALGEDAHGYRAGFVALVEQAAALAPEDAEKDRNVIAPDVRLPWRGRE